MPVWPRGSWLLLPIAICSSETSLSRRAGPLPQLAFGYAAAPLIEVLLFTLSFVLSRILPFAIVRRDLNRLPAESLARAWPEAGFHSAVFFFGPLCLPIHFVKTRKLNGILLGLGWLLGCLLAIELPIQLLAHLVQE